MNYSYEGLLLGRTAIAPTCRPAGSTGEPGGWVYFTHPLSFEAFLAEVAQNNLEYAAQRYNVSIAQAQIARAKVFPNPTLAAGSSRDISGQNMPSSLSLGITQTFLDRREAPRRDRSRG